MTMWTVKVLWRIMDLSRMWWIWSQNVNVVAGGREHFHIHVEKNVPARHNNDVATHAVITLGYIHGAEIWPPTEAREGRGDKNDLFYNKRNGRLGGTVRVCACEQVCLFSEWGLLPSVSRLVLTVLYSWSTAERSGTCFDIFNLIH